MKKTLALSCVLALAGLSNVAMAADGGASFLRGEIGRTEGDLDVAVPGALIFGSDDDTSYSVRGGYWFTANVGVEGFYSNLYERSRDGDSFELSSYGLGVVAKENFGANDTGFFIGGRAGIEHLKGEMDLFGFAGSESSNELYYGVGVGYDFSEVFGLSINYDFHEGDSEHASIDADTVSLGAEVRF